MLNTIFFKNNVPVEKYLEIIHSLDNIRSVSEKPEYLDLIPRCVIAKCPVCNEPYIELLDLFTLRRWVRPSAGSAIYRCGDMIVRCNHFIVTQYFINFNNIVPKHSDTEIKTPGRFNSEVPHVMPMLFDEKIESYAVMHSLPICRIEEDRFVPRYTLYMITYYTQEEHKELFMDRLRKREATLNNYEMLAFPLPEDGEATEWWDLKQWVDKGKLFWLEPDNPDLPLIKGPVGKFPYGDITGRKEPYFETVPPRRKKKLFGLFGG